MITRHFHLCLALLAVVTASVGCEVPAADGTVEITMEGLSSRDIDNQARALSAVAGLSQAACTVGPCSPNPCPDDPEASARGATRCVGMGDVHMCRCPAGQEAEMDGGPCVPDQECSSSTCNDHGECMQEENVFTCVCETGYTGERCERCDAEEGFFPDGLGGCSNRVDVCRDGQGAAAFEEIIASATEELGHSPSEIELTGARLEVVEGSAETARSWEHLWSDDLTLFVQPVSGFPHNAGRAEVPPSDAGFDPIEFDIVITRPTTSSDQQFHSGDFRVGISGPTDRLLTDDFKVDVKIVLDFAAY